MTFPLKLCRNKQRAVCVCFVGKKDAMQIRFTLKCIQYVAMSVLQREQYTFGVKRMLDGQKFASVIKLQSIVH